MDNRSTENKDGEMPYTVVTAEVLALKLRRGEVEQMGLLWQVGVQRHQIISKMMILLTSDCYMYFYICFLWVKQVLCLFNVQVET